MTDRHQTRTREERLQAFKSVSEAIDRAPSKQGRHFFEGAEERSFKLLGAQTLLMNSFNPEEAQAFADGVVAAANYIKGDNQSIPVLIDNSKVN